MQDTINKIISKSDMQYDCVGYYEGKKQFFWHCNECGFYFIRKPIYFKQSNPGDFCKACNKLNGVYHLCERDFLLTMQEFIYKYDNLCFVVQVEQPELRGKRFTLKSDLGIYESSNMKLPLIIIEVNENNHSSYRNNQDNLQHNYFRKMDFYKKRGVPILEANYIYNSQKGTFIKQFNKSNIKAILEVEWNQNLKIKQAFPYMDISMYK